MLLLFGLVVFVVILVGFGLEIRSILREEPGGA